MTTTTRNAPAEVAEYGVPTASDVAALIKRRGFFGYVKPDRD